jgi:hypothetical protein
MNIEAVVEPDGAIRLTYDLDIRNGPRVKLDRIPLSLPGPLDRVSGLRAFISERIAEATPEHEGAEKLVELTDVRPGQLEPHEKNPGPIEIHLGDAAVLQGEAVRFRLEASLAQMAFEDRECHDHAGINLVTPWFFSWQLLGKTRFVGRIHLPAGLGPEEVLPQINPYLHKEHRDGRVVVEWRAATISLSEPKELGVLFPKRVMTAALPAQVSYGGDYPRLVVRENHRADVTVETDASVSLAYSYEVESTTSCLPVRSIELVHPSDLSHLEEIRAWLGDAPLTDIHPPEYAFNAIVVELGDNPIPPRGKGRFRAEARLYDAVVEDQARPGYAHLSLRPRALAAAYAEADSTYRTRFQLPPGVTESESLFVSPPPTAKRNEANRVVLEWEGVDSGPFEVSFPAGVMSRLAEPTRRSYGPALLGIVVALGFVAAVSFWLRRRSPSPLR